MCRFFLPAVVLARDDLLTILQLLFIASTADALVLLSWVLEFLAVECGIIMLFSREVELVLYDDLADLIYSS